MTDLIPADGTNPWGSAFRTLWEVSHNDDGTQKSGGSGGSYLLSYDTTGATDGGTALQAAYDAGYRVITIPAGTFKCDTPVFLDAEDGNSTTFIIAHGVQFVATTNLPTVAEFETYNTNRGFNTGTKWFMFPSTYRAGLSGGVVTTVGHNVTGTATLGGPKSGVHPHLIMEGGSWSGRNITNFNAGFIHTNTGGATEVRSMHMNGARTLLGTGSNYIDGNKMRNCSAWEVLVTLSASHDMALFYQYGSGDGVEVSGCKCANYILTAKLISCNSAELHSNISGAFYLSGSHGIHISGNHTETANNITTGPRFVVYSVDSHFTYDAGFDYLSNTVTDGLVVVDDSGLEGHHTRAVIRNIWARRFMDPNTSDPVTGQLVYINKMNDRSIIAVENCWTETSASDASFGQAYGGSGAAISGNASNEPTLAAAVVAGRDIIGSGSFKIYKSQTSTMGTGQNQAMNITIGALGNLGRLYASSVHVTPTSYNSEAYGATGTLTNGQAYAYAFAVCNTLPDGTIQYGKVTAERLITAGVKRVIVTELYMPSAAGAGATLVVWRKTGTGVLASADSYTVIPVGQGATRLFDTGVNINGAPWITASVPVPNTVAATNHTADAFYLSGSLLATPASPYVGELGNNTSSSSSSTLVVTLAAAASAATGSLIVARVVCGGGANVSSIADSRGNTWTVDKTGSASPKSHICSTGQDVAQLQVGDTVTFTLSSSVTQKAAVIDEFTGYQTGGTRVDVTSSGTATTTSRDAGTTAAIAAANELIVACFGLGGVESAFNAGVGYRLFNTGSLVATGTSVEGMWRTTSTITTYNPTATGSSISSNGVAVAYKS